MCDGEADVPSVWRSEWRRARLQHRCVGCSETILKGDRYHYCWGVYDGHPEHFKHCARCWVVYGYADSRMREYGMLASLALDCGDIWDDPPVEVAELAFMTHKEIQELAATLQPANSVNPNGEVGAL